MPWQISLFITIFLIVLGFVFKKSKELWIIQIIWIWILMAGSNGGVDWTTHNNIYYNSLSIQIFEDSWLYKLFCYPFVSRGYSFTTFNMILNTILLIILFIIIKKNTKNVCYVTSLITIFPLADLIIQKRNFCASIIFLLGILPILRNEKKSGIKFLIFTFLAAQIHSSFYLYFLMYPLMNLKYNKLNKVIILFLLLTFASIPFIPKIATIFVPISKVNFYFYTLKIPLYQSICWWIVQLTFTFLFYKEINLNLKIMNFNSKEKMKKVENEYIKLNQMNKVLLIFMPLYYYEPTFFRFFRNLLIINYIYISKIFNGKTNRYKSVFTMESIIASFVLIVFLSQFVFFGKGFDYLVVPIFESNMFLGG